jgi:hypothetical protein
MACCGGGAAAGLDDENAKVRPQPTLPHVRCGGFQLSRWCCAQVELLMKSSPFGVCLDNDGATSPAMRARCRRCC